jgi:tetratricopeptide (TPR) repeat protein
MARSVLRSGLIEQRDRAQQRGRLDAARAQHHTPDPDAVLDAWLEANAPRGDVAALQSIGTTAYLRATAHVDHAPAERLRQLAVWLEPQLIDPTEQPRAWLALDRLYAAASVLEPTDVSVHRSRAVSARRAAEAIDAARDGAPVAKRMRSVAYEALDLAVHEDPHAADLWFTRGRLHYGDPESGALEALAQFDRALVEDPGHEWSLLYRAHCLHDLERWPEAAAAYEAVPPAFFVGARAWRYEHLLEQRAWCWLRAGETARAETELDALLTRWERSPALAHEAWGVHVVAAAEGPLRAQLYDRVRALAEREANIGGVRAWPGLVLSRAR